MSEVRKPELGVVNRATELVTGLTLFTLGCKEGDGVLIGLGLGLAADSIFMKGFFFASCIHILTSKD